MPHDPEAFAEMVVLTIKSALAPVLERLAVSEQANRDLQARVQELSGLRDRVTTIEVKSAMPAPVVEPPPVVDLGPVLERVAGIEGHLSTLGDVRDRVAVMESKAAVAVEPPHGVDLAPLLERIVANEARLSGFTEGFGERVAAIEAKASTPVQTVDPELATRVVALETRVTAAEAKVERTPDQAPVLASIAELTKDISLVRERVAVMEVRAQVPGPAGKDGKDGLDGKDGADGLGWDDLVMVQNDDRSISLKAHRGDRVKELGTARFPWMIQRGVFVQGKTYEHGDVATWGGSSWHCERDTMDKPGEGSKDWTLIVKRGRDGKDGRDALPTPVVTVGRS